MSEPQHNSNNKPLREAVALEYNAEEGAPRIIASGRGAVAESILRHAREHDVPVYEDPELAQALNLLRIGDEIPPELYNVIAQILVFVGDLDKRELQRLL